MLEIKGYITNLGKYNEGELIGEWITFPIDEEERDAVLKRIGINDDYEEYFFTDWETEFYNNFGEYESIDKINEYAETIEEWDEDTLLAACECWSFDEVIDNDPNDYILMTDVRDNYDLGYYYAIECYCVDFRNNDTLERYFDFESYGRDINFEVNGDFTGWGYIEYMR